MNGLMKIHSPRKIRTSPLGVARFGLVLIALTGTAFAQELISNGNFDVWESTTSEPPEGIPMNWSISASTAPPVQGPAIAKGAAHSAVIIPGPGNQIVQGVKGRPLAAHIEVLFATTEPEKSDGRSFNMNLGQVGIDAPWINFRIVRGSAPGKLSLEAFDGNGWEEIAPDLFEASEYDREKNVFGVLKPQVLRVSVDAEAEHYSVSGGPDTSRLKHFPKLKVFQSEGGMQGISSITFSGANSQAVFAVGRVAVTPL
jgi:hypothetical protein